MVSTASTKFNVVHVQIYKFFTSKLFFFCLIVLLLINSYHCNSNRPNRVLQSPLLTDWGEWGRWENCPLGTFVIGMQLKVESKQQIIHDDTGLNGIRFICSSLLSNVFSANNKIDDYPINNNYIESTIESCVGPFGSWRSLYYCNNGVVIGFQLRSEPPQGKADDTAANNLRIICSDGEIIQGEGTNWGYWTWNQKCPKRTAICALQTQVEAKQGFGTYTPGKDDTALNNLRVECCPIPNPAQNCTPSDYWELVSECDNTNAFTPTTCTYERKVGLGYAVNDEQETGREKNNVQRTILEDVGWTLGIEAKLLAHRFQFETGPSRSSNSRTGFPWSSPQLARSSSNLWNHEISTKVTFDVPPGVKTRIIQVVGTCGMYLVRTSKFQRLDSIEPSMSTNNDHGNNTEGTTARSDHDSHEGFGDGNYDYNNNNVDVESVPLHKPTSNYL